MGIVLGAVPDPHRLAGSLVMVDAAGGLTAGSEHLDYREYQSLKDRLIRGHAAMFAACADYRARLASQGQSQHWPMGYPQGWLTQPLSGDEIREAVDMEGRNLGDFGPQPPELQPLPADGVLRYDEAYFRDPAAVNRCVRLAGGGLAGVSCALPAGGDLYLYLLLVDRPRRRLGIARTLLDDFVGYARLHGYVRATLDTGSGNVASNATYRAFGFEEIGRDRDARGTGVDTVHYAIVLDLPPA